MWMFCIWTIGTNVNGMNIIFNEQFHDEQNGGSFVPIYDSTIKYLLKFGIE